MQGNAIGQAVTLRQPSFREIDRSSDLAAAYRLRYQVYCLEKKFLRAQDYPNEIETDSFDRHAIHMAGSGSEGRPAGTCRLILPSALGFPIQRHCKFFDEFSFLTDSEHPFLSTCAEISRLGVSKRYVRGDFGRMPSNFGSKDASTFRNNSKERLMRRGCTPEIALGLYKTMYQVCKRRGITHMLAAMEKSLVTLLRRLAFDFKPVGPEVDYYGPVTPYMAAVKDLEVRAFHEKPKLFWHFMDGLTPQCRPDLASK